MRRTKGQLAVARAFLAKPDERRHGFGLIRETGVQAGRLYPMLARWERSGVLRSYWETQDDMPAGQKVPRKYYTLTEDGRDVLNTLVAGTRFTCPAT